jgi:hypothetical protein
VDVVISNCVINLVDIEIHETHRVHEHAASAAHRPAV